MQAYQKKENTMEKVLFNNGIMKTGNLWDKKGEMGLYHSINTIINSKLINLRHRPETTKRLIANIGGKFSNISLGKDFLNNN